ncbi:carbamoyl phosphate synthase preATP-grasp domain-containing protein [Anaplasma phagocytophilum]
MGQEYQLYYSRTQACKVLQKESHRTILVNSNSATIMTASNLHGCPQVLYRKFRQPLHFRIKPYDTFAFCSH